MSKVEVKWRLPRFTVELDADILAKFTTALPRGVPTHLVRWFIETVVEFGATPEGLSFMNEIIYNRPGFDRKAALIKLVEAQRKAQEASNARQTGLSTPCE